MMKTITIKSSVWILMMLILSSFANASIWLEEKKGGECAFCVASSIQKKDGYKTMVVKQGSLRDSVVVNNLQSSKIYLRDFEDNITVVKPSKEDIEVKLKNKGSYNLFFTQKYIKNNILNVDSTTIRFYNKNPNIKDCIAKEIRGKTIYKYYDKPPMSELDFEIIMLKQINKHQINCCLYSGDTARFKIYYKGKLQKNIPLKVTTKSGWSNTIMPNKDGVILFEIPRTDFEGIEDDKKIYEKMIVEAIFTTKESGLYNGTNYSQINYYTSMPLSYSSSPLEYSSQLSGFYVLITTILVLSVAIYYYRRKKKKDIKEIWFDEN